MSQLGQAMIDNAAAASGGTVSDPAVYQKAIDSLKNNNTPAALQKKAEWAKSMSALTFTQGKVTNTVRNLNGAFLNSQYYIGRQYALNPTQLIQHMRALYEEHAYQIDQYIQKWRDAGVDPSKYQAIQNYQDQFNEQVKGLEDGSGNYAFVAHTNKDGKIEAFTFQPVKMGPDGRVTLTTGSQYPKEEYARTYASYGGFPLLLNTQPSPDPTKQTGVIGNLHFVGQTGQPLDLQNMNGPVNKVVKEMQELLPGQHVRENNLESQGPGEMADRINANAGPSQPNGQGGFKVLHFSDKDFITPPEVGPGSAFHDAFGNYYYVNDDGELKQGNSDAVSQLMGIQKDQLEKSAPLYEMGMISNIQQRQTPEARQNTWITNPTLDSPMNSAQDAGSPQSMAQPVSKTPLAVNNPTLSGGPSNPPAIQQPGGKELAKANTQKITQGANLPNALQQTA